MQGDADDFGTGIERICIQPIGLNDNEMRMLKSLCAISAISKGSRTRRYTLAEPGNEGDIHLVCARKPDVFASWKRTYVTDETPAILIVQGEFAVPGNMKVAQYPLIPSRLLAMLDGIKVNLPEAADGDEKTGLIGQTTKKRAEHFADSGIVALVADDSPTTRKQVELGLRELGIKTHCVVDGSEALKALQTARFGMVFLDVMMPGADGYEVCRSIKRNKSTANVPVIMLTGKTSPFDRVRGSLAGCDSYLTKPVQLETFVEVVRRHLDQISPTSMPAGSLSAPGI